MKIFTEPKIYLIGYQNVDQDILDTFYFDNDLNSYFPSDITNESEALVELAGRIDYLSYNRRRPGGNKAYIGNLLSSGHGSPLEMAVWSLIITQTPRSCVRELFRHRIGMSPSELSQRYIDLEELDVGVCVPPNIYANKDLFELWQGHQIKSRALYQTFSEELYKFELGKYLYNNKIKEENLTRKQQTDIKKLARESSRSLLPEATETKCFITLNARCARNILELRCSRFAAVEIRKLANLLYLILSEHSPNIFQDYTKITLPDGTFELTTPNRKV